MVMCFKLLEGFFGGNISLDELNFTISVFYL